MANSITDIKTLLAADTLVGQEFSVLADIASLKAVHGGTRDVQDLVIRALDRAQDFRTELPLLMSLARDHGLFPYIDDIDSSTLPLADLIALEMHRPDGLDGVVFHRVQAEIYRKLMDGQNVMLSAPTSFGKTVIMDALIASGRYKNILLIIPTIALIDEIRRRLNKFDNFKTITHPGQSYEERNLFVLTQERYLAIDNMPELDLFFIDEFYKLDDDSDRSVLLNQAVYQLMKTHAQFYLAAPLIQALSTELPDELRSSLIVTDYTTVAADTFQVSAGNEEEEQLEIKRILSEVDGPTLIYCKSPNRARTVSRWLQEGAPSGGYGSGMHATAKWIEDNISYRWSLPKALRLGIGTHHGRLPRWLGPLILKGFDEGNIRVLVCTNSLIEGVNTRAKDIIILDKKIANSTYKYFDFANIKGRGGRMLKHFVGKIFVFNPPPPAVLPDIDIPGLSQSEAASDSLLLFMDEKDRTSESRERLKDVLGQRVLSKETMSQNPGIDPSEQIKLAKYLTEAPTRELADLQWNGAAPTYGQLSALIGLIWDFIPPSGTTNHLAKSAKHLTFLANQLAYINGDVKQFIAKVAEESETDDAYDAKVEDTFNFLRFWIDHNLPARIRAVDNIAKEILPARAMPSGNFEPYASRTEAGFQTPLLLTAEEFGIPSQISRRLLRRIPRHDSLDAVMSGLRSLDHDSLPELSDYERGLVKYALFGD